MKKDCHLEEKTFFWEEKVFFVEKKGCLEKKLFFGKINFFWKKTCVFENFFS